MPRYLFQVAYTPEAWAAQMKNPQNRTEIVARLIDRLGGRIESAYLAFGEYDLMAIAELPDNVSAAALSMSTSASGALKTVKTTPLLTMDEGLQAMRKGAEVGGSYHPPGT